MANYGRSMGGRSSSGRRSRPARRRSRRLRSQYGSPPREGGRGRTGAENNKNVDLMLCPQTYITADCVKMTPTQIKFYNGEGPY